MHGVDTGRPRSAAAHQRMLADRSLQFDFPALKTPEPPGWARWIGEVLEDPHRFVQMRTRFGGKRIVDWLSGDQLPRIC